MKNKLMAALADTNITLTESQAARLALHWDLLMEANAKFNLTAIREADEAVNKHYLDSLLALPLLNKYGKAGDTLLDVGSGGGFPGLVLASAAEDVDFTLMDATNKKCDFLRASADTMGLKNVSVLAARAEDAGQAKETREHFDLVTARAVAALPVLLEYCIPFLKTGGILLAYKGSNYAEEVASARHALAELKAEIIETVTASLPGGDERAVLVIRKNAATLPKYPRRNGIPSKKPL